MDEVYGNHLSWMVGKLEGWQVKVERLKLKRKVEGWKVGKLEGRNVGKQKAESDKTAED